MAATLLRDVWFAVRSLRRTPGFTALAVLTLALGTGANTAIFTVINGVLVRPLPYHQPDRLVFLWNATATGGRDTLSPARFLDFRSRMTSLSMAAICQFGVTLSGPGGAEQVDASSVSSSFFDVLGTPALLGDPFHAGSADPRAVVLSHGLWVRRFGADPVIVGREVVINGTPRRIAAVMPREFAWPGVTSASTGGEAPELWIPGALHDIPRTPADSPVEDLSGNRRLGILRVIARVADAVPAAKARREAEMIAARLATEYPDTDGARGAVLVPVREQFLGPVTRPLEVLLAAVVFVLAIACANVASLLLGRGASRRREIAVRLALGATRAMVARQLLTEAVVLSLAGSTLGLWLAWQTGRWLVALAPGGVLRLSDAAIDPVVLGCTLIVALGAGLLSGALPAWQVSGAAPDEELKSGGLRSSEGGRARRIRSVLVAGEVALALVLMVGAGLLLRSFGSLASTDSGVDQRHLLTFSITAPRGKAIAGPQRTAFYEALLQRVQALPGVTRTGAVVTLPIGGDTFSTSYLVDGRPAPAPGREPSTGWQVASPGYFAAIGMRVLSGRGISDRDTAGAQGVVVVNQTLARQAWPDGDPVGRRLRLSADAEAAPLTVIGVVSDVRHGGPASPPRPEVYQPLAQRPFQSMAVVVRTAGDPLTIVPQVRAEVAGLDPTLAISHVGSMDEHVSRALSRPRFMSTLTTIFGALAAVLALVGIYGVMACSVAERSREIAIRIAVGAPASRVVRMIVLEAAGLAAAGVAVGLPAAWASSRLLSGLLFGVTAGDLSTYAAAAVGLLAVAVAAAVVPALRAGRIDGATMLRS